MEASGSSAGWYKEGQRKGKVVEWAEDRHVWPRPGLRGHRPSGRRPWKQVAEEDPLSP